MKKLILAAVIGAAAFAHAVTMASKTYVNDQINVASNNIKVADSKDPNYYKNSMWYLGTGTEGGTVTLKDHTCTYVKLTNPSATTEIRLPAPIVVNGQNRSRSMYLAVETTFDTKPNFNWFIKDAAGNTVNFYGRDDDAGIPTKGFKIITISEVKQNSFFIDYADMTEIMK